MKTHKWVKTARLLSLLLVIPPGALQAAETTVTRDIDRETLDKWSAPYRGWHYQPEHVIPAEPNIPDHDKFVNTDVTQQHQKEQR